MAETPPNMPGAPLGAEPLKKTTGKVAPKKETVRINLPPKPSAAPTIKLPTLPPGGPTGAASAAPAPAIAPRAPAPPPRSAAAPAVAGAAAPRATTAPPAPRPAPAPKAPSTVSAFDKILAIAAMLMALGAVGTTVWMMKILNKAIAGN